MRTEFSDVSRLVLPVAVMAPMSLSNEIFITEDSTSGRSISANLLDHHHRVTVNDEVDETGSKALGEMPHLCRSMKPPKKVNKSLRSTSLSGDPQMIISRHNARTASCRRCRRWDSQGAATSPQPWTRDFVVLWWRDAPPFRLGASHVIFTSCPLTLSCRLLLTVILLRSKVSRLRS